MDETFWHGKWQRNEIGFHEPWPNALLTDNFMALRLPVGARVFVPLCGKSRDIHWLLEYGYQVAGIELSPIAVTQLFFELGLAPRISPAGPLLRYEAGSLCVFTGNVFSLTRTELGHVDAVYDRAALIALPAPTRVAYARHLITITEAAPELVISMEYDQSRKAGPPFSVDENALRQYYGDTFTLDRVAHRTIPGGLKGSCPATESVWVMKPRYGAEALIRNG
ncbi:thiopurine S-methyltransferase [Komagataeibacter diospyri]|uniref:thiopurine S-methyltransferase n=1 Tax=Komagataeibacter diospyri TaxID=1932662 RepID=UPI0011349907|nr:thiopurine S-methyltransferase [Komagataeibacter diospyri]GCE88702.1 thiopurine S-methyltransferase [Komagataeibacter diospyri]